MTRLAAGAPTAHRRAQIAVAIGLAVTALLAGCVTQSTSSIPGTRPNLAEAARINTELGRDYARQGLFQVAEEKLKRAIRQRPDYAPAHSTLAYVYWQRGEPQLAEQEYRRALNLAPDDPDTQNNFGAFLCAQGQYEKAQRYFRDAATNRDYSTPEAAWTNAGVCARTHGSLQEAEADLRRALQINPNFASALEQMTLLSFQRKDYLRARAFFQRYQQVTKPGPALLWIAAQTERALGDRQAARDYETQLLQQYPESDEAARLTQQNNP